MRINLNFRPSGVGLKKLIILFLFALACFFIKGQFADAATYDVSPPFLESYYDFSTSNAIVSDELQGYSSIYTKLEQWFSELSTVNKKIIKVSSNYSSNIAYEKIYFFVDFPKLVEENLNTFLNGSNAINFTTEFDYYVVEIYSPENSSNRSIYISKKYSNEVATTSSPYQNANQSVLTNFDLYNSNNILVHSSDIMDFTFLNISPNSGIGLKLKKNENSNTYVSYNWQSDELYGSWYNLTEKFYYDADFDIFQKPVSGNTTFTLPYSTSRFNDYVYFIGNRGEHTVEIGYLLEDVDIIYYDDFYSDGYDSQGNKYYNPFSELNSHYDKETDNIFDIVANIPKTIGNFFKNLLNGIVSFIHDFFIPNPDWLDDYFEDEYSYLQQKLGFLFYPITVLTDFATRFYNIPDTGDAIFNIPNISFMGVNFISSSSVNLSDIIDSNQAFTYIYSIYRIVVSGFIVIWLTQLAIKSFKDTFGGGFK